MPATPATEGIRTLSLRSSPSAGWARLAALIENIEGPLAVTKMGMWGRHSCLPFLASFHVSEVPMGLLGRLESLPHDFFSSLVPAALGRAQAALRPDRKAMDLGELAGIGMLPGPSRAPIAKKSERPARIEFGQAACHRRLLTGQLSGPSWFE